MSKIMVFIYKSLVRIENALFRFYPVLASMLGFHGHVFCTVWEQIVSKIDPETMFEKQTLFNAFVDRFWTIFGSKITETSAT